MAEGANFDKLETPGRAGYHSRVKTLLRVTLVIACLACTPTVARFSGTPGMADGGMSITGSLANATASTAFTFTPQVTLSFGNLSKNVTRAQIANGSDASTATPVVIGAGPVAWTLSDGDGVKTVSAILLTGDGGSKSVSATITLDTQAPIWRAFATATTQTNQTNVTFTYDAQDNLATPQQLQIAFSQSGDPTCKDGVFQAFGSGSATVALQAPKSGTSYVFNACVVDQAGNLSPFATTSTAGTQRSVAFDDTPPSAPILNTPLAFSGSALVSWTDLNTDSQLAIVDYSTDSAFATFASATASAGACLPARVAPGTSLQVTGLENFRTWYFRVRLADCAGNTVKSAATSALVGVSTVSFADMATPLTVFTAGSTLWLASTRSSAPQSPHAYTCDTFLVKLRRCDLLASDCTDSAGWSPPAEFPFAFGVFPDDNNGQNAGCDGADFGCDPGTDPNCGLATAPRVAFAQSDDELFMFAALTGYAKSHDGTHVSAVVAATCSSVIDCTNFNNWTRYAVDQRSDGTVLGAPSAVIAAGRLALAYTAKTSTGSKLQLATCDTRRTFSHCLAASEWSAPFGTTAIRSVSSALEADATVAPTIAAMDNRIYVGVSTDGGAEAASVCGRHALPAMVRCANDCTNASDLAAVPFEDAINECAAPPTFAVTPEGLTAAWRSAVPAHDAVYSDTVRVATCAAATGCHSPSEFSAPVTLVSTDTSVNSAALASRVELSPHADPVSHGTTARLVFSRADTGEIFYASCDRSRSECATKSDWTPDVLSLRSPGTAISLGVDQAGESPLIAITNRFAPPALLLPSVPAPFSFFATAGPGEVSLQWRAIAAATGTAVVSAPLSSAASVTTLDIAHRSVTRASLAFLTPAAAAVETARDGDRSNPTQRWQGEAFTPFSHAQAGGDFGPMSLALVNDHLYALSGSDTALTLYACDTAKGCADATAFSAQNVGGTGFAQTDLAADFPRHADGSAAGTQTHLAIAATKAGALDFIGCTLGSTGTCTGTALAMPASPIVSSASYYNPNDVYTAASEVAGFPAVGVAGNAFLAVNAATVGIPANGSTFFAQRTSAADMHWCGALAGDPSSCLASAAAWTGATIMTNEAAADDAGSATVIHDLKALVHPSFGWVAALAAGHGDSTTTVAGGSLASTRLHYVTLLSCAFGLDCTQFASWGHTTLFATAADTVTGTMAIAASGSGFAPLALADESRDDLVVAYYGEGSWQVSVCAESPSASDYPCRTAGWATIPLIAEVLPPVASSVQIVNGDIQALFLSTAGVTTAICPLGFDCAAPTSWHVQPETPVAGFAQFAKEFSVARGVPFAAHTSDGHVYLNHGFSDGSGTFGFNFWSAGRATIVR